MKRKYSYCKVIQGNYGYGWDDESFYETNSSYTFRTNPERAFFRDDLRRYKENSPGSIRVVNRRELNRSAS